MAVDCANYNYVLIFPAMHVKMRKLYENTIKNTNQFKKLGIP